MPWRLRPRAALVIGLLCALFIAAVGLVRTYLTRHSALDTRGRGVDHAALRETSSCATVRGDFWNPLFGVDYTGRLGIALPPRAGGAIVLFIGDALPLDIEAESSDGTPVPFLIDRLRAGPGLHIPPDLWLESGSPWSSPREVVRARLDALPDRDRVVYVHLGRRAPRVLARLMGYDADARASVCAARLAARAAFAGDDRLEITPARSEYFAMGWYGVETASPEAVRWMKERGVILIPSARDGGIHISLEAAPAASIGEGAGAMLSLRVNDVFEAPPVAMRHGFARYDWAVPDASWVSGTNEVLFTVSATDMRGGEVHGLALKRAELRIAER
jgi:hypothetical protein